MDILVKKASHSGFTLVEVSVAMGVIILMATIGVGGHSQYKKSKEERLVRSRLLTVDQAQLAWLRDHPGKGLSDATESQMTSIITSLETGSRTSDEIALISNWSYSVLSRPSVARKSGEGLVSIKVRSVAAVTPAIIDDGIGTHGGIWAGNPEYNRPPVTTPNYPSDTPSKTTTPTTPSPSGTTSTNQIWAGNPEYNPTPNNPTGTAIPKP